MRCCDASRRRKHLDYFRLPVIRCEVQHALTLHVRHHLGAVRRAVGRRFQLRHTPRRNATRLAAAASRGRNGQCAGGHGGGGRLRGSDDAVSLFCLSASAPALSRVSISSYLFFFAHTCKQTSPVQGVCTKPVGQLPYQPSGPVVGLARIVQLLRDSGSSSSTGGPALRPAEDFRPRVS